MYWLFEDADDIDSDDILGLSWLEYKSRSYGRIYRSAVAYRPSQQSGTLLCNNSLRIPQNVTPSRFHR